MKWNIFAMCVALMLMASPLRLWAADAPSLESRVRAAFLFNFIQFTDWPEGVFSKGDEPIVVGVLDPDPLGGALDTAVAGKSAGGHPIVVKHLGPNDALNGCHVIFIGSQYQASAGNILGPLGGKPILTVGDFEGFAEAGGVIRFFVDNNKERFEINVAAAEAAHLHISSKLLKLAKVVGK